MVRIANLDLQSITAIKESRMLAWQTHIDGAAHILKTRGPEEMCKTPMGILLFTAVRHHLVSPFPLFPFPFPFFPFPQMVI